MGGAEKTDKKGVLKKPAKAEKTDKTSVLKKPAKAEKTDMTSVLKKPAKAKQTDKTKEESRLETVQSLQEFCNALGVPLRVIDNMDLEAPIVGTAFKINV
jgi:hypothetical protein